MKDVKERIKDAGHLLREKRKEKKLTMEDLAKIIKKKYKKPLTKGTISGWEKGNRYPTPEYTIALCDFLEIDANVFLEIER